MLVVHTSCRGCVGARPHVLRRLAILACSCCQAGLGAACLDGLAVVREGVEGEVASQQDSSHRCEYGTIVRVLMAASVEWNSSSNSSSSNSKAAACWTSCRLSQKHFLVVKHQTGRGAGGHCLCFTQLSGLARTPRVVGPRTALSKLFFTHTPARPHT